MGGGVAGEGSGMGGGDADPVPLAVRGGLGRSSEYIFTVCAYNVREQCRGGRVDSGG